jgi:predicted Zn-dependent protease
VRQCIAAALAVALACTPVVPVPFVTGAAAQPLPDLGDSSQAALTPAQEPKIGQAIMRQIRAQGAYLQDPEVNDYFNEL